MISETMLFIIAPQFPQVGSIFLIHPIMLVLSSKYLIGPSSSLQPVIAVLGLTTQLCQLAYYRVSRLSLVIWFIGFIYNPCIWPVIKIRSHLHQLPTFCYCDNPQLHNSGTRAWFHATAVLMCSEMSPCLLENHQLLPWSVMPTTTGHTLVVASKVFKALQ